jgi:hypothetical protein
MKRMPKKTPAELARRFAEKRTRRTAGGLDRADGFRRQTYLLPREEAQRTAREWFERYPKAAYMTEVESWCVLDNDFIEFTMRRLPSAD